MNQYIDGIPSDVWLDGLTVVKEPLLVACKKAASLNSAAKRSEYNRISEKDLGLTIP